MDKIELNKFDLIGFAEMIISAQKGKESPYLEGIEVFLPNAIKAYKMIEENLQAKIIKENFRNIYKEEKPPLFDL